MDAFERALSIVLAHEGGDTLTDDPLDPGGVTRFGISQAAHPTVDIRNLTRAQAAAIYRREYWDELSCSEMPGPIALCVFDGGVNQGVNATARLLQDAVGTVVDGDVGPKTLQAVARYPVATLVRRLMKRRTARYIATGGFATYGRGWINRAIDITADAIEWAGAPRLSGSTTGDWHGIQP